MLRSIATLRSAIKNRLALLIVMLALLGFFSFGGTRYFDTAQQTSAQPCYMIEHYYYAEAAMINLVGLRIYTCGGGVTGWGIITQYDDTQQGGCCGSCCD